jgi:hypothetical protein
MEFTVERPDDPLDKVVINREEKPVTIGWVSEQHSRRIASILMRMKPGEMIISKAYQYSVPYDSEMTDRILGNDEEPPR